MQHGDGVLLQLVVHKTCERQQLEHAAAGVQRGGGLSS